MKKGIKITLIALAALLVLAVAALALALVLQLDLKGLNPTKYVTNTYTVTDAFWSIDIELAECGVRFEPALDGQTSVICSETEHITHSVEVVNDTLTIRRHDDRRWYEHFGLSSDKMYIVVYLASSDFESLRLSAKSGDLEISDQFSFNDAELHTSSGDISFSADVAYDLSVEASSGDVYIGFCAPQSIRVESSSGDITLDSVNSEANVQLSASSGDVTLNTIYCSNLSVDTSSGAVDCFGTVVYGDLLIETGSGSVKLDYSDGDYMRIHTGSGSVSGILEASKDFRVSSSSGKISVPPGGNGGICEIKTSSGSINIQQG